MKRLKPYWRVVCKLAYTSYNRPPREVYKELVSWLTQNNIRYWKEDWYDGTEGKPPLSWAWFYPTHQEKEERKFLCLSDSFKAQTQWVDDRWQLQVEMLKKEGLEW